MGSVTLQKKSGVGLTTGNTQSFPPQQFAKLIDFIVFPPFKNKSFLHQKYVVERLSIAEIANDIFSSTSTVHKYLQKFSIPLRPSDTKNKNRLRYGEAWRGNMVVPHKQEQLTISKMRNLRIKGFSYWKIADILNSMNIPTKTRKGRWHSRSVKKILDDNSHQ